MSQMSRISGCLIDFPRQEESGKLRFDLGKYRSPHDPFL